MGLTDVNTATSLVVLHGDISPTLHSQGVPLYLI